MNIKLTNAGKKHGNSWIFHNLSHSFTEGRRCAILGPNGSGKSTLLKIISGSATFSEGSVEYSHKDKKVAPEDIFQYISIAAPWLDIPEEYTLEEIITFHKQFKPLIHNIPTQEAIKIIGLEHTREKYYKNFSSGMKQRVKLGLAILTDVPLLLLDEPATALDVKAVIWYGQMLMAYAKQKTILVFSNNREEEYAFCEEKLQLTF